jgi:hypothetical protein
MRALIIAATLAAFSAEAMAHSWYSKRRDPIFSTTTCCGGYDCAPLPQSSITFTPDGDLRVTLSLEEARKINPGRVEPFDEVIPFDRIQVAEDGQPHICLMRMNNAAFGDRRQGFYCIFLPPNG